MTIPTTKYCKNCALDLAVSEFNRNCANKDGLQTYCRSCQIMLNRRWARANPEKRRAQLRKQYEREMESGGRDTKKSPPEKRAAQKAIEFAIKRGDLVRPDECQRCFTTDRKIHAHHDDYSKPLVVQWVCTTCHGLIHSLGDVA